MSSGHVLCANMRFQCHNNLVLQRQFEVVVTAADQMVSHGDALTVLLGAVTTTSNCR